MNKPKRILCKIGLHSWRMQKEFMQWKCKECGIEKEEYWA
jgi:hypothetical protein